MDRENEYVVFYNDSGQMGRFPSAREIVVPGRSPLARLWREHVLVPLACKKERVDVLHCPKSAVPFFAPCPVVVTLHDLIPISHPETEKFAARIYWRIQIPIAARRSSHIITDSEHAREEIMAMFNVPADRISAIMLGFSPAMGGPAATGDGESVRSKYGLPEHYILYVGTIQPRKNIPTLLEAFNLLKREHGVSHSLVIVGRKGWLYNELFDRICELGLERDVIFTGFVPDEELPGIYAGADVFSYLSFFEGFGLPPLEAMACGVPVVVSNTTSLPEVVADAGIAVEPLDVPAVAESIHKILTDPHLARTLRERGIRRSSLFSWERTARETLGVYRRVALLSARRQRD
jgi:glycosyltransferase involved in cell wall biosynthesis